jgi:signal transduction histidine kinase
MKAVESAKKTILVLLAIMLVMVICSAIMEFTDTKARFSSLAPRNGILDLSGWNPEQDGLLSLGGEWDFYWHNFLSYDELKHSHPDVRAVVPSVWNDYQINGRNLPGFGYATYRLKVINAETGTPIALRIPNMSTAYSMYINDELIASNGKAAVNREYFKPEYRPKTVQIRPPAAQFDIIVRVANFIYSRGGMWYPVNMGTPEQIQDYNKHIVYRDIFLFTSCFILGLYYLSIFLLRREDKSSLYFVFMCLVVMGRTVIHGDYAVYTLIPAISFGGIVLINYVTLYWFPTTFVLLLSELFPQDMSKRPVRYTVIYSSAMTLVTLLAPLWLYTSYTYLFLAVAILVAFYTLAITVIAFVKKRQDSPIVLLGALVIIAGAVYDVLCYYRVISLNVGELSSFGFVVFLFLQSFVLARRFSQAFTNVKDLSRRLLEMDKIKDEFLANTSHELRTPLNGILGLTEAMLRGSEGKLNTGQYRSLSLIALSSRRLAGLVNDILDYSKMKHSDIKLNLRPLRINSVVETTLHVFRQLHDRAGIEISHALPKDLPPVLADENRLAQIMYNLVGNAVKFTTRGHVKVTARVCGEMLEICVEDTGPGIPGDKLADIFKSFEQVDASITRQHGGTGLGLSITRHLVESHGGEIWVDSVPGKGSKFYFTLPVTKLQPGESEASEAAPPVFEPAPGSEKRAVKFGAGGAGARILIVDDEILNLQSAVAVLKTGGYSITAVSSGVAALEEINKNNDISLVILDVMMPEMSGYEVCRQIRNNKSHYDLPVLMLTAKTRTEDIVTGFEAGANDYLPKPVEAEELLARVKTLVNLKISVDKARAAEVAFLQAQIKPHFLFNVLNTISAFCDTDPERAGVLIDELANYLRQSFDFNNLDMFVPLDKEISLVKSYLEIEKARFGEDLVVEFDINPGVLIEVPPLTVQPLVENAIRHGLRKKGGRGTVTVAVQPVPGGVAVTVSDDGRGMDAGQLDNLFTPAGPSGVGLRNIHSRLNRLYGKGLSIWSKAGQGTVVSFTIPSGGVLLDTGHHS